MSRTVPTILWPAAACVLLAATLGGPSAVPGALVSYWPLDEGSGSTAYNSVAGRPNGSLDNMEFGDWIAGHDGTGYALDFDGVNEQVNFGTDTVLNAVNSPLSVGAWVKTTETGAWYRSIVSKYGTSGITPFWGLGWHAANELTFVVRDSGGNARFADAPTGWGLDDEWHQLVGVRGGGKVSLYGDGSLLAETTDTAGNITNTRPIIAARHHSGTPANFVEASIDDIAIWDEAVTPYAVDMMAKGRIAPPQAGSASNAVLDDNPVAYWRLEEQGASNLAADFTGNGHTATYQGGVTQGVARPLLNFPDNRNASLDGSNDYIVLNSPLTAAEFGGSGSYSIEMWFNADRLHQGDLVALTDVSTDGHGVLLETNTNGTIRYLHRVPSGVSGGQNIFSSLTYETDHWHQLVVVNDNGQMRLYLDTLLDPVSATAANPINFSMDLALGRLGATHGQRYFDGMIDEVALYNYALTPDQIARHFTAFAVPEPATLAIWSLLAGLGLAAARRRRKKTR